MIYYIKAVKKPLWKIGYVINDPARRLSDIQTAVPYDVELIALLDGTKDDEKRIHNDYEEYKRKVAGTEWFELTEMEYIKLLTRFQFGADRAVREIYMPSDRLKSRMKMTFNIDDFFLENYNFSEENNFSVDEGLERSQLHEDVLIYMKKADFDDQEIVNMTRKKVVEALNRHPCGKKRLNGKLYYNMQRASYLICSREV